MNPDGATESGGFMEGDRALLAHSNRSSEPHQGRTGSGCRAPDAHPPLDAS